MHGNQWKQASVQLLQHWRRSGILHIPLAREEGSERATEWLSLNDIGMESAPSNPPVSNRAHAHQATIPMADPTPLAPFAVSESKNPSSSPKPVATTPAASTPIATTPPVELGKWLTPNQDFVARDAAFQVLNETVVACRKCEEIVCRRQRTVFGVGPVHAKIVMFGEAPGADEDRVGEPFVGAAGQLLDKILNATGLKREEVYIMNSLKCRPPHNRNPSDTEIENCRPYFEAQLETIKPEYIVCWGSVAVRAVLQKTDPVGKLRGRFHAYRGAKVLVTYHPAYLLRNPDAKKLTWEDMKLLMREIGIPVPSNS